MASIQLKNASIRIPVFDYSARKLLNSRLFQFRSPRRMRSTQYVTALDSVSLSLGSGDRIGIIGPNGAGKTTLLRLLAGVYQPTSGFVAIDGRVNSLLDISFGIEPDLSGRESIRLRGMILGLTRKEISLKEDEIVEFSELGRFIEMPTRTYSSGMFVRLAFSIATVLQPEILVMDEWLSVGDQAFREKAEKRLAEIVQETEILVLASHSRELIESACNIALWIQNGQVMANGLPSEVCGLYFESTHS